MKKFVITGLLLFLVGLTMQTAAGDSSFTKTFYGLQKVSLSVDDYNEKRILTFPDKPLEFASKVVWEVAFDKRGLITNDKASVLIEVVGANGQAETVVSLNPEHKESGELTLQPDQVCRLTLYAGKYNSILKKYGSRLDAQCTYQRSQVSVRAIERSRPGQFGLNVTSIPAANWIWTLPDGNRVNNNTVETTFSPGYAAIQLLNPQTADLFQLDLQVPEPIEANPSISPLEGYEDLTVQCFANAISHYQSTSKYLWDFGDGSGAKTTEQTEHTYTKPGVYPLKLKIVNSLGPVFEKTWDIRVLPFAINNSAIITPGRGPVPITLSYKATPDILGTEPTSIQYLWNFGDGTTSNLPSGEHVYRKVGDYPVRLTLIDKNHPNLKTEPWVYTVTAIPPILDLAADASQWSGSIPLRVRFRSSLRIDGGPTDIEYYWDFNDGTFSRETNPIHTFIDPGRYQVRLEVTDRIHGTVVAKRLPIDVRPPQLSLKVIASQPGGIAPLQVTFRPVLNIEGGPTRIEYVWDFDDGTSGRTFDSSPVSHKFSRPGLYTVRVTARDRIYHGAVSAQVRIEAKSPEVISRPVPGDGGPGRPTEKPPVPPGNKPGPPFGDREHQPGSSPTPTPSKVRDTKAPELAVKLSPNKLLAPGNQKMIQIAADIQVKDDQDPDPDIRLVSISCNQKFDPDVDISGASIGTDDRSFFLRAETDGAKREDRIYTVTYSATDISGNSKTVTITVTVPFSGKDTHDDKTRGEGHGPNGRPRR